MNETLRQETAARLAELTDTAREYVSCDTTEDGILRFHVSVLRAQDGERIIMVDHRSTFPTKLNEELSQTMELITELATSLRALKDSGDELTEKLRKTRVIVTADRLEEDSGTATDVLLDADLLDVGAPAADAPQ